MGKRNRVYLHNDSIKLEIILKQNCRCAYCNRPLLGLPLEWDHIIPHIHTTTYNQENWAASCQSCNSSKGGQVMDEAGLCKFIIRRMSKFGDIGEGAPDGHVEYWKRYFPDAKAKTAESEQGALENGE